MTCKNLPNWHESTVRDKMARKLVETKSYEATLPSTSNANEGQMPPHNADNSSEQAMSKLSEQQQSDLLYSSSNEDSDTTDKENPTPLKPHPLQKPLTIGQVIGKRDNDLRIFKSPEVRATLPKSKLLYSRKKRSIHSWTHSISVNMNEKRALLVKIFLVPKEKDETTILHVTAKVADAKLMSFNECGEKCWVLLETELMDQDGGKKLGFSEFAPRVVNMNDGKSSFHQKLVKFDEVKSCDGNSLNLHMKATLVVSPINDCNGFVNIEMPIEDRQE